MRGSIFYDSSGIDVGSVIQKFRPSFISWSLMAVTALEPTPAKSSQSYTQQLSNSTEVTLSHSLRKLTGSG